MMKKRFRIKKEQDFKLVFKKGKSYANRQFVVYLGDHPEVAHLRLGISVSKRLGNAVKRNKIKRRIRAFFQQHKDELKPKEYIVIARNPVSDMDYHQMEKSLLHVLKIAKCIK
ncbi:ribonuclease P protein component [Salinicoccus kekensis]|uniref:Ribonuclease P protein component n=2 Tax=Salinicoccus kekensis TaxID=714307 RepID=A0A285UPS8_9STAP|nr:ribonuclease P protein component [Salinicoccus kekensis]